MMDQTTKMIELCEEDILNLKNAYDRIYKTLDRDYEALELFTIKEIIYKWENK